jgi:hypothetical protein
MRGDLQPNKSNMDIMAERFLKETGSSIFSHYRRREVQKGVMTCRNYPQADKSVLCALIDHFNPRGRGGIFPKQEALVWETGLSMIAVKRSLAFWRKEGVLIWTKNGSSNSYTLKNIPKGLTKKEFDALMEKEKEARMAQKKEGPPKQTPPKAEEVEQVPIKEEPPKEELKKGEMTEKGRLDFISQMRVQRRPSGYHPKSDEDLRSRLEDYDS